MQVVTDTDLSPTPSSTTKLGELIRVGRVNAKLTQKELGTKLDALQSSVSAWEQGKVIPRVPQLIQMAEILGVDCRALFDAALYDHQVAAS